VKAEGEIAPAKWILLTEAPKHTLTPPPTHVRKRATDAIKRLGVQFIYVEDVEFTAKDLYHNRESWGLTHLGSTLQGKLYRID
jgi:hypothetical protein